MTNICRCGSYRRIRAGIHQAAKTGQGINSIIHMVPATAALSQGLTSQDDHLASCSGACEHDHGHEHNLQASLEHNDQPLDQLKNSRGFSSNCA